MAHTGRIIVVGVDFGSTFSGVAWAISGAQDEVSHIDSWPQLTAVNRVSDKVPTRMRRVAHHTERQWGFRIAPDAPSDEVLRCFKLMLDRRPDVQQLAGPHVPGYTEDQVDELIFDYLNCLGTYLVQHLQGRYGEDFVRNSQLQYVFTVPAIWSEHAVQRTRRAFERAVLVGDAATARRPIDITEPEAAAICVLQRADEQVLRENQCFMVVDAGGWTVDLISYVIRGLHPLEVEEAVPGSGDVCGGATVADRFRAWLLSRAGEEEYFDDEVLHGAVEAFDTQIKPAISSAALTNNPRFSVPVTGLDDNRSIGIFNERMEVSAGDIVTFFQPSIERIKLLVAQQIAASNVPISTIMLVGGYGQSKYLKEELEADELIRERGIKVHQPEEAWTAVVEGAVMKGMSVVAPRDTNTTKIRLVTRRARKHYGTQLTVSFDDRAHSELTNKRRWDGMNGCFEVDVMVWFIKKGEPINETRPYTRDFLMTCRVNQGKPQTIYLIVYVDEQSEVAPLAMNGNVRDLCTVEADLRQIPESQIMQVRGSDGFMYYYIEGQIEASYGSASVAYTLIYNGQRYNTVQAEYT